MEAGASVFRHFLMSTHERLSWIVCCNVRRRSIDNNNNKNNATLLHNNDSPSFVTHSVFTVTTIFLFTYCRMFHI